MKNAKPAQRAHRSVAPLQRMADDDAEKNYITALERGLAVIRAFSGQRDQLTLAELSKLVGLARATVRRCLITLKILGYVSTDGKYFRLTPQVLTLSQAYFTSNPLPHIAQPFIEQASRILGESCSISVLTGDEVIYVARSVRKRPASVHRGVGVNLPAYCTSMGRVLLASLPKEDLDAYFGRIELRKFNHKTITDEAKLREIIDQVRHDDFCIIDGELESALRAIAIPVRNASGIIIAAAHVSTERAPVKKMQAEYLPVLRQMVSDMRRLLIG
jgi:IclR family transcriptional regulator, pca regulon regulatory protein